MTRNTIFLFFLLAFTVLLTNKPAAQVLPQLLADPKPYRLPPITETAAKDAVKQLTCITKLDIERGLKNDTTRIYYYDTQKRKIHEVSYETGKPFNVYYFRYNGNNLIEWSEEDTIAKRKNKYFSAIKYNAQGNILCSKGSYISKKDTAEERTQCFEYDTLNNITKMTNSIKGYTQSYNNFYFSGKNLTRHDIFINPRNTKNYMTTEYTYNAENLLEAKKEFQVWDTAKTLSAWHYYYYDKRLLINERYLSNPASKTETKVSYSYYEDNTLKEMFITRDSLYKNVHYDYENKKPKKITAHSNAWNYLNGEFLTLLRSINELTIMPYDYEEQFNYDKKGNLVEKKILLNGTIVRVLEYKIDYY